MTKYFNNVATGFTCKLDTETGEFSGIVRAAPYHRKDEEFSGVAGQMSEQEEETLDELLTDSFDRRTKAYKTAHKALLPGWYEDEEETEEDPGPVMDCTVKETPFGLVYEGEEWTKELIKVEKKELLDGGCIITGKDGSAWILNPEEYDADDIKTIRKGSVIGYLETEEKTSLVCGYSPDFIDKEIKKYLSGDAADDATTEESHEEEPMTEESNEAEREIHDEVREQIIIETDCPHCGTHIDEVEITEHDDEIICTKCGESIEIVFYESMYDYMKNADLSYYEIADGEIRETPFVEEIKPIDDQDFVIFSKGTKHDGDWYTEVNFGENEESWMLDNALNETVFLVYTEESEGHYVTDGRVYETEKEAKAHFMRRL
ncbi:MAG: hypothetical protein PHX29_06840 [Dehalococcoidales bacterium]|nr:hypothetical protein [Dehalococcoidales bacterium]